MTTSDKRFRGVGVPVFPSTSESESKGMEL